MAIQYSIQKMVSDGTLSTIALGIQYLQRNDIYIRIAGEETPQSGAPSGYTWSFLDNTTLKILPVVPNGVEVVVYRRTDVDAMYNVYSQNAQFDEATIDENNQQLLYIAQEYLEQGLPGAGVDTLEYVRDDGYFTYYRLRRTDGSYSDEFTAPSASNSTKVLTRESLRRSYAEAGYTLVVGSFEQGGTVATGTDVLLYEAEGKAYSWDGVLPKVVPPSSTPASSGGIGAGDWVDRTDVTLRSELAMLTGSGLVGGIEVTAESFGVVSGLVSLPVARTNANKIMNKAAELSAAGGGKIIFTKPLYQVHMDEADFSASASTLRVAALKIPYDNVILCGQGWGATTLQAYATNSAYGVVQWTETPQQNGVTKVFGVGLHDICIDGNYHGDFTPASYVRQVEGVLGAGIEGLNIRNLKVKNCSHYGMGLQNGGYKGCSIDGYWSENTGADGIDIKDNGSVSRAFQLSNIFIFNFGQLDEPEHPWAGVDVMSLAPEVSNVFVSDFGDKGQPGAAVRIKQGPIGDLAGRGTGGAWANVSNITGIQNRFKASPSEVIVLHIKAPNVNYSNIVAYGDGGKIGRGVWLEERYCQGANVQISHVVDGYAVTSATGPSERVYGDADACSIVGLVIVDAARAAILNRKHQKLNNVTMKDCPVGFVGGGSNIGKVVVKGLHLDNVADPFGQLGGAYHSITDVTGPNTENWQSGLAILKTASDFATTAVLSKNGVRLYSGSTDETVGTELARFTPTASNLYSSLIVAGNAQSSAPNTNTVGTGPTPWAGAFFQTAPTITSDERYKSAPAEITDAMLDAAAEVDWCMFQYLDRVEEKGVDSARWHFGAIAQRFVEAFERHGLDPYRFAFICYDEWGDSPELIGEDGEVISPAVDAGSRYGIRYEQAIILKQKQIERDHRRQLDNLLSRIEALESA